MNYINKFIEQLIDYKSNILYKLHNIYWWVRHRTIEKYHIIDTGLPPGYNDKPEIMLSVNFNLLVDYVEKELVAVEIDWSHSPEYIKVENEIIYLYNWWKNYNKSLDERYLKLHKNFPEFDILNADQNSQEYRLYVEELYDILKLKEKMRETEDDNLIRLMKIRRHLWT